MTIWVRTERSESCLIEVNYLFSSILFMMMEYLMTKVSFFSDCFNMTAFSLFWMLIAWIILDSFLVF